MIQNACKPATVASFEPLSAVSSGMNAGSIARGGAHQRRPSSFLGNDEPSLEDMLSDEVVVRLMDRDGVVADQLRSMLDRVRASLT